MDAFKMIFGILFLLGAIIPMSAQDWANLQRFQQENAALSPVADGEHRIVFMGNSITEGWSHHSPGFFKDKPYVNRGIGGQTTPQMLLRFRQDVIDLQPSVVVILAGINDIAGNTGPATNDEIAGNIQSMAELAEAHQIKVVLCSVLPAYDFPWRPGLEPAGKVVDLNAKLKAYAAQKELVYVDYFSVMVNEQNGLKESLGYDGVHPNADGYAVMEPLVEKGILEALGL
ncbi:MAG: SGNH/GDSL hydrolase family protein [Saprospiraceae bacterium]